MSSTPEEVAPLAKWEMVINRRLSQDDWYFLSSFAFRFTSIWALQENRYKILHQWYCWWCSSPYAGFIHIWWACWVIQPFWQSVCLSMQCILGLSHSLLQFCYMTSRFGLMESDRYVTLMTYLLCAASVLIAAAWKQIEAPSFSQWQEKVKHMFCMAKLSAMMRYRNSYVGALQAFCT